MPGPVQVDVTAAVNQLASELGVKVGPRLLDAAIGAINDTAAAVQKAQVHEMRDVFDRPTPYTLSSVYMQRAARGRPQAKVGLKDFSGKGIAASQFLAAQITGGERRLKRFEKALRAVAKLPEDYIAVPGAGAQLDAYGNIKPSQIVQILSYFKAFPEAGYRANMTDKRRKRLAKGGRGKEHQGFRYFVGRPGGRGALGVWQASTYIRGAIKPVLLFVPSAQYEATFDFAFVAENTVQKTYRSAFEARARLVGVGR